MPIFSIGHSTHAFDDFAALLARHEIEVVADVRSAPFSRRHPQFSRDALKASLRAAGVEYVFLGDALGGRPADPDCFRDGAPDYVRMTARPAFREGLARLLDLSRERCVAMMCAERHPLNCHRARLVARALMERGVDAAHILADGRAVLHSDLEDDLLAACGLDGDDLFAPRAERLALAYEKRAAGRIASR